MDIHSEVHIPSPSVLFRPSPVLKPTQHTPLKKNVKPRNNASSKAAPKSAIRASAVKDGAITKPKQSKSRNGMSNAPPLHSRAARSDPMYFRMHDLQEEAIEV